MLTTATDFHTTRATINDVARRAGVSHQTVSRVVNEHPNVAPSTRERVLKAIHELDFQPNQAARSLASQRSATLGVVSLGITFYGQTHMVANIEQAARARGYRLAFANIPELNEGEIDLALLELRKQRVEGVLLIAPLQKVDSDRIRSLCRGVPFVLVDALEPSGVPGTTIDQFAGGRLAAEHLIGLGHTRIALLGGSDQWHDAHLRTEGWRAALTGAGLTPVSSLQGDWTPASGFGLTHELLAGRTPFTGLLVGSDHMALGTLCALHGRGVAVPGRVSVVGFDDIPESRFFYPPLTTVRQDFAALGVESLAALLEAIESPATTAGPLRVLTPALVVRASTAPPGRARER